MPSSPRPAGEALAVPIALLVAVQPVSLPLNALVSSTLAVGEKIGWRGFLLPAGPRPEGRSALLGQVHQRCPHGARRRRAMVADRTLLTYDLAEILSAADAIADDLVDLSRGGTIQNYAP